MARAVRDALLKQTGAGLILLPAIEGFDDGNGTTFNPSYYVMPAIRIFAEELPDPVWQRVWDDGLALLTRARFGPWALPPDWGYLTRRSDTPSIAGLRPTRCSFDAVRLPLYLCWASCQDHPAVASFARYWSRNGGSSAPAWSDLRSPETAPYHLTPGMEAIRRLVNYRTGLAATCEPPSVASTSDYYAASLIMLVRIAMQTRAAPAA